MPDPIPLTDVRPAVPIQPLPEAKVPEGNFDLESFLEGLAAPSEVPQAAAGRPSEPVAEAKPQRTAKELKAEILAGFNDVAPEAVAESVLRGADTEADVGMTTALIQPIEELTHNFAYSYTCVDGRDARAAGDARVSIYSTLKTK